MNASGDDLVLAGEWVVTLWVPANGDGDAIGRLAGEVSDALAVVAADLSRESGAGATGMDRRVDVDD